MRAVSFDDNLARPRAHNTEYELRRPIQERSDIYADHKRSKSLPIPARVSLTGGTDRSSSDRKSSDFVDIEIEAEAGVVTEQVLRPVVIDIAEARIYEGYSASPSDENGPVEVKTTIGTGTMTISGDFRYTDSSAARKEPPSICMWVGPLVLVAFLAIALTGLQMIGWGSRMGRTVDTRPLFTPLGADPVQSRVLAALSSLSGILMWIMVVAVCASSQTSIERAARRPILPVFLEAVRNRTKLSKAKIRRGWRIATLHAGTALGAGAGAAMLAAAVVEPATRAQQAILLTAVVLIGSWAFLHMLALGTLRFSAHRTATLTQLSGVVVTLLGVAACVYEVSGMWYYAVSYAMLVVLSGLALVFLSVAWQNRYERVELRSIW